jgi:hypothetical protein
MRSSVSKFQGGPDWRRIWRALDQLRDRRISLAEAKQELIAAGLSEEAAVFRIGMVPIVPEDDKSRTSLEPIPTGEYTAMISKVDLRAVSTKNGPGVVIDITYMLQAPDVAAKLSRASLTVRQGIFVDLTPAGGFDMSKGKNVELNRIRAAVGQDEAGKVWNPKMLEGAGPLMVNVELRSDGCVIYTDVAPVGNM